MAEGGVPRQQRQKRALECSICLERFRNPKTLPCLHSFCEDCLTDYAPPGTRALECPLCKERIEVPDGDATNFKTNFHLNELVEEITLTEKIREHSTEIICNCCDEELVAISKCLDCDQYLCAPCLKAHRRFPALRDHSVATFDEVKMRKIRPISNLKRHLMCSRHPSNKAEIFCTSCEMPICHICATLKHNSSDHVCVETSEAAETRRQSAAKSLKKLKDAEKLFTKAGINAEYTFYDTQVRIEKLKGEIKTRCNVLMDKITSEKKVLLDTLDAEIVREERRLEKYKSSVTIATSKYQSVQQEVMPMIEDASDGDFMSFYGTMKSKMDQMCLKKPRKFSSSLEQTCFQTGQMPHGHVLGQLADMKLVQINLITEYRPNSHRHIFYDIDTGRWWENSEKIYELAVTDKASNKVTILDSRCQGVNQVINGAKGANTHGVAFSEEGASIAVTDDKDKVKIYRRKPSEFQLEKSIDTQFVYSERSKHTVNAIVVDSTNHIIVGKTHSPDHQNWLMRFGWDGDGVTSLDGFRIPFTPSFLAFTRDHSHLLVSDMASGTVACLNRGGLPAFVIDVKSFGQQTPTGVCCDHNDSIFVASIARSNERDVSSVHKYSSSGIHLACLGDFPHPIYGIVFTKEGKLAAACGDAVKLFHIPAV